MMAHRMDLFAPHDMAIANAVPMLIPARAASTCIAIVPPFLPIIPNPARVRSKMYEPRIVSSGFCLPHAFCSLCLIN